MTYAIKDSEFNAALKLNADYRYNHFIINAKKGLEVFVLKKQDELLFLSTTDENNNEINVLPLWCHEKYAEHYAQNNEIAKDFIPQSISLAVFIEKWLPQLNDSNIELAIFPVGESDCNVSTTDEFLQDFDNASK